MRLSSIPRRSDPLTTCDSRRAPDGTTNHVAYPTAERTDDTTANDVRTMTTNHHQLGDREVQYV